MHTANCGSQMTIRNILTVTSFNYIFLLLTYVEVKDSGRGKE